VSTEHDMRSEAAADRLLEQFWTQRQRRLPRRELLSEAVAGALFLLAAATMLLLPGARDGFDPALACLLVGIYVILARIEFPVGAGNMLPTQLVLVPMLVLLPPATVPPLVALGLLAARLVDWLSRRSSPDRLLFSIPDAWHAIGAAVVLLAAGAPELHFDNLPLLAVAFISCCAFDAGTATLREAAARGVAPTLQLQAFTAVWMVDACLAPIGFLAAELARREAVAVLFVLPLAALLVLLARDRRKRIEQAQHRLEVAVRERARLQAAVRRLGDAFAAKLDVDAVLDILLLGSIEALDGDAGTIRLAGGEARRLPVDAPAATQAALDSVAATVMRTAESQQVEDPAGWALGLALRIDGPGHPGAICIARDERPFQPDEVSLLEELVAKAQTAAAEIVAHHALREAATRDSLTGLGNRRKLADDLRGWLPGRDDDPRLLMLFDLNGFKSYNDTFGHLAGDALLSRLGAKLRAELEPHGEAYRLGGDEFCAVLKFDAHRLEAIIALAAHALSESGEEFSVTTSYGVVVLPHEAGTVEQALQLADERMYSHKRARGSGAREQARDVLMRTMHAKRPTLGDHANVVGRLSVSIARRLGMNAEEIDEIGRAAELHDIGKVGIPDAVLDKPGPLNADEWAFVHQHTILGERILNAAVALRPVARVVRSTHERWDGTGYPDRLAGTEIPLGARIIAVCDAYDAMTAERPYRPPLSHELACDELRASAGTQFDPEVVEAFLREIELRSEPHSRSPQEETSAPIADIADRVRTLLSAR
jgi:diguanylate cyclase (GGDEF)-like protein